MDERLNLKVGDKVIVRSTNPKVKQHIAVIQSVKYTPKTEVSIYKVDDVLYDNFGDEMNPRGYNSRIIKYDNDMILSDEDKKYIENEIGALNMKLARYNRLISETYTMEDILLLRLEQTNI